MSPGCQFITLWGIDPLKSMLTQERLKPLLNTWLNKTQYQDLTTMEIPWICPALHGIHRNFRTLGEQLCDFVWKAGNLWLYSAVMKVQDFSQARICQSHAESHLAKYPNLFAQRKLLKNYSMQNLVTMVLFWVKFWSISTFFTFNE